jgi:superfamily II DNA or RNA helicase
MTDSNSATRHVKVSLNGWTASTVDPLLKEQINKALTFEVITFKNFHLERLCSMTGFKLGLIDYLNTKIDNVVFDNPVQPLPEIPPEEGQKLKLRDYQLDAANAILKKGFGIIQSPTASGKTLIEIALADKFPKPVLVIVPSRDLLHQVYTEFSKYLGKKYSITKYGGYDRDLRGDIVVMTNQALALYKPPVRVFLKTVKALIADEVHHCTKKLYSILGRCPALYRAGLSATPGAEDWQDVKHARLIANFGGLVYEGSKDERVKPFVMYPLVYEVLYKGDNKKNASHVIDALQSRDPVNQHRYEIIKNENRNRFILKVAELCRRKGLNTYIAVAWTEHVDNLKAVNDTEKIVENIHFLTGDSEIDSRNNAYSMLYKNQKEKEPIVICGTVGAEGVDLTLLNVVIFGDGGKSIIKVTQTIGRAVRTHPEKKVAIIIDIQDAWYMQQVVARKAMYKNYNYERKQWKDLLAFLVPAIETEKGNKN